ncbi:hypothetical protein H8K33_09045 [Undibacterium amnicola]|uniref:Phosphoenolpyruvate synthase n=1 Tax=Undibacterium amnicola TaxID=1834038 RepID=A0ABR6XRV0_9BURK|nr:PEP/pyruvate-binding domain-containing protein [Undibacterium amnicola]MBC3831652.1 hypothetical protein [Undibacterium amnicola]
MNFSTLNTRDCFVDCRQVTPDNSIELGGKGAQLALLSRYGLPVPASFVIPSTICRALIPEQLWEAACTLCTQYSSDTESVGQALQILRQQMMDIRLRADFRDTLHSFLSTQNWQQQALAVRSSAIGEDGQQHSFAGIHHSELNVIGSDALEIAILQVITSLWTPQACAYREKIQYPHIDANMAVVIMPMVHSVAAGVIFTCDPRDGREDRLLISSVHGLANDLVAGKVNGEDILVQHDWSYQDWHIAGRRAAHATTMEMFDSSPKKTQSIDKTGQAQVLSDAAAIQLAQLATDTAKAFDYGQPFLDIEWVFDGQEFFLVQARPVSARGLHTYPSLQQQGTMWTNGNTKEILPYAIKISERDPMLVAVNHMLTLAQQIVGIKPTEGIQRAALFNGHVYLNASIIQWEIYQHFNLHPDEVNFIFGGHQATIQIPQRRWYDYGKIAANFFKAMTRFPQYRRRGLQEANQIAALSRQWRQQDLRQVDTTELLSELRERARNTYLKHQGLCLMQGASGTLMQLQKMLDKLCGQEAKSVVAALMSEGEISVSAQQAYDLMRLAKLAAEDPAALYFLDSHSTKTINFKDCTSAFKTAYTDFLDQYGHRGNYESYISRPSWREQAEPLHLAILNLTEVDTLALQQRQAQQIAWAWEVLRKRCGIAQRSIIKFMQKQAKMECNQREFARSHFGLILERSRALMLEIGRRLHQQQTILDSTDIFHLDYSEIDAACTGNLSNNFSGSLSAQSLRHRIADRKLQIAQWDAMSMCDVVLQTAQGIFTTPQADNYQAAAPHVTPTGATQEWQGIAVSMASYRGKACLIDSPADIAKLKQGDVAVALSTDPSWLPIFLKAGGMIVETGGYLSHSAIVARELGIPTIVNLPGITTQLRDGDEVFIDGPAGRLLRLCST